MKRIYFLFGLILFVCSCRNKTDEAGFQQLCKNELIDCNHQLTQVIVSDIFSPPVCSRIYAYCNIAAYEALVAAGSNKTYTSFAGKLNGLKPLPKPEKNIQYNYSIASAVAFTTVAQKLVFNADAIKAMEVAYLHKLDSLHVDEILVDSSVAYGRVVGNHILDWVSKDGYLQRTSFGGYLVTKEKGRWVPTPPDYTDATENNWRMLRPLTMDSCSQLRPGPPITYDTASNSEFYKEAVAVYKQSIHPNPADSAIAWYWDDNPNTSITDGHITYFVQKISPPGHWIYIACSVAEKENYDAVKAAHLIAETAVALYDGFIACWEAKYFYNYLRPITFINSHADFVRPSSYIGLHIDEDWQPLIQTPPFPEYPGGHGCISASAATVLTHLVGDNYKFTDSTETPFGRPKRTFNSFNEAAAQANMSRFYGGIHFLNSLKVGSALGKEVGNNVIKKLE